MAYILVLVCAFFTKGFLNSKLCSGEAGFFRTFFVFGFGGAVAISVLILWVFGAGQVDNYGAGERVLFETFRVWILFISIYMVGIGLGLYRIKIKGCSSLLSLYINIQLASVAMLLLTAAVGAKAYFATYAITVGILYFTIWQKTLICRQISD